MVLYTVYKVHVSRNDFNFDTLQNNAECHMQFTIYEFEDFGKPNESENELGLGKI